MWIWEISVRANYLQSRNTQTLSSWERRTNHPTKEKVEELWSIKMGAFTKDYGLTISDKGRAMNCMRMGILTRVISLEANLIEKEFTDGLRKLMRENGTKGWNMDMEYGLELKGIHTLESGETRKVKDTEFKFIETVTDMKVNGKAALNMAKVVSSFPMEMFTLVTISLGNSKVTASTSG
jgi:hypothetical protein